MRLRFTIRDLLWLAALIAVCVGWWVHSARLSRERDDYQADANKKVELLYQRITQQRKDSENALLNARLKALLDNWELSERVHGLGHDPFSLLAPDSGYK